MHVAAGGGTCAECVISRQCSATSSLVSAGCTPRAEPYRAKHACTHSLPVLTLGGSSWGLRWIAPTAGSSLLLYPAPHTLNINPHAYKHTPTHAHFAVEGLGVRSPARLRRTAHCSHHFRTHCRRQGRAQRVQMCKCARIKRVPCVRACDLVRVYSAETQSFPNGGGVALMSLRERARGAAASNRASRVPPGDRCAGQRKNGVMRRHLGEQLQPQPP